MVLPKFFTRPFQSSFSPAAATGTKDRDRRDKKDKKSAQVASEQSTATNTPKQRQPSTGTETGDTSQQPSLSKSSLPKKKLSLLSEKQSNLSEKKLSAVDKERIPLSPRSYSEQTTNRSKNQGRKSQHDPDLHPLNLPPEERRRLSHWSGQPISPYTMADQDKTTSPSSPNTPPPANDSSTEQNGTAPAPPPHKSSPPPQPTVDAEACKAAGNKFFKAREYTKAIQEYSKG